MKMPRGANPSSMSARALLALLGLLLAIAVSGAACEQQDQPATPRGNVQAAPPLRRAAPEAGPLSAPLPLEPLRHAAGAEFRAAETDGAFTGGGATYTVRAAAGAFELAPIHHPRRERADAAPLQPVRGNPIRMETTRVARGERVLAASPAKGAPVARVADDGHLVIARGPVEEHLRNLPEGVELSYGLAEEPSGEGDLVVEVAISGQALAGETDAGLHFKDPTTGLGVRVGRATWIDAGGRTTPVPLRATAAGLELRVPAEVLASSAYPALLDPVVSPEIGTDAPVSGPATGMQSNASITFDGTHHFVAWSDYRTGTERVYGTRMDATGAVIDPAGIHLGDGTLRGVAQGGGVFLVLYTTGWPEEALRGAIVDPAGVVSVNFPISAPSVRVTSAAVAFDGTQFMAAWASNPFFPGGGQIYHARVTPAGVVLDPGGVATVSGGGRSPALAAGGANLLLVYANSTGQILGARITPQGTVLDPAGFLINGSSALRASVAFDGTNYVVGWLNEIAFLQRILTARVSPQGAVLDAGGIVLYEETEPDHGIQPPQLASDGASTLVLWTRYPYDTSDTESYFVRLSPQGTPLTPAPVQLTASGSVSAGAASGSDIFVVWTAQLSPVDSSILGGRVSPQNELLDVPPVLVSRSANGQEDPSAAFDGQNFVVTWSDDRGAAQGGFWDIRAMRISPAGQAVDATSISVHTSNQDWMLRPRAAFDGANTVLAWWSCNVLLGGDWDCGGRAVRLSSQGSVVDPYPPGIAFGDYYMPPAMAISSGAGSTLLAGRLGAELNVGFFSQAGVVSGLVSVTAGLGSLPDSPTSAFDGTHHLLVWSEDRFITGEKHIYGTRVTSAGALLDGQGVPLVPSAANAVEVAIAWNGTQHLVVWRDTVNGAPAIRAQRLTPQLQVLDAQGIDVAAYPGCDAVALDSKGVAWDGQRWVVAWRACGPDGVDVLGAEVSDMGGVLSSFPITEDAYPDGKPSLATTGNGVTLATYTSLREAAPFGTTRVFARIIGLAACSSDAECIPTECQEAGVCNPTSGCVFTPKPDGTTCGTGGTCEGGVCTPLGAGGMGGGAGGSDGAGGAGTGGAETSGTGGGGSGTGAGGTGGAGPVGSGGATSAGAGGNDDVDASGCDCSAAGGRSSSGPTWAPLLLAVAWGALRYRRR